MADSQYVLWTVIDSGDRHHLNIMNIEIVWIQVDQRSPRSDRVNYHTGWYPEISEDILRPRNGAVEGDSGSQGKIL